MKSLKILEKKNNSKKTPIQHIWQYRKFPFYPKGLSVHLFLSPSHLSVPQVHGYTDEEIISRSVYSRNNSLNQEYRADKEDAFLNDQKKNASSLKT